MAFEGIEAYSFDEDDSYNEGSSQEETIQPAPKRLKVSTCMYTISINFIFITDF
jgi:hypothetical protein